MFRKTDWELGFKIIAELTISAPPAALIQRSNLKYQLCMTGAYY